MKFTQAELTLLVAGTVSVGVGLFGPTWLDPYVVILWVALSVGVVLRTWQRLRRNRKVD